MTHSYNQRNEQYQQIKHDLEPAQGTDEFDVKEEDLPPKLKEFISEGEFKTRRINLKRLVAEKECHDCHPMKEEIFKDFIEIIIGKRNGLSGCRDCCSKVDDTDYQRCVSACMSY